MKIEKDKFVGVTYDLHLNPNEAAIESVGTEDPLTFIAGAGMLLPKFEDSLMNLGHGDSFDFVIKSEDAYGDYQLESIFDLPMEIFMSDGKPREDLLVMGNVLPIRDQSGKVMNGKVIEIAADFVKMDFNHPLAGKDLNFKGKVVEVRDATPDDMSKFFAPQSGGCSGCSCDDSACDDSGCGSGCGC